MERTSSGRIFRAACALFAFCLPAFASFAVHAQSTYGAIIGTVRDQSGALVAGASVSLVNIGTTAERIAQTDASGNYSFTNIDPGDYKLTLAAPSFQTETVPHVPLTAREVRRVDAELRVGVATQTVEIIDNEPPVINTEASSLTQTKVGDELTVLPVAVYSRSTGSTSPISTLTTEAGVQTDDSGELAVMGTTAALLSVTIDGISSVGVEYSGPVNEMFPSFNSIEEIQISESNNNAEFSGVADITTVSKGGTIHFHGGLFENNENTVYNAGDPFTLSKPRIIMNDFGGTLGGPLRYPSRITGTDHSFFFLSYRRPALAARDADPAQRSLQRYAQGECGSLSGGARCLRHLRARRSNSAGSDERAGEPHFGDADADADAHAQLRPGRLLG